MEKSSALSFFGKSLNNIGGVERRWIGTRRKETKEESLA